MYGNLVTADFHTSQAIGNINVIIKTVNQGFFKPDS
jgi:hypothetical protein